MLIIGPVGQGAPPAYTWGIYGFVMDDLRACPRCHLAVEEAAQELATPDILDQVNELLTGLDGDLPLAEKG